MTPEVFIAMAKFERSLSNNELNYSMMQKIFLAQTLNLGWDAVIDRRFVRIVWLGLRVNPILFPSKHEDTRNRDILGYTADIQQLI